MTDPELFPKDATDATGAANAAVAASLPLADPTDRVLAERDASPPVRCGRSPVRVGRARCGTSTPTRSSTPMRPTVNPSLWRQAQLNRRRAVRGGRGLLPGARPRPLERLVHRRRHRLDRDRPAHVRRDRPRPPSPCSTSTSASARSRGDLHPQPRRPLRRGPGRRRRGRRAAGRGARSSPRTGFLEAAISENVIAGNAMSRRATYMYGALLPKGPQGHVDAGLGKGVPLLGTSGLIAPTEQHHRDRRPSWSSTACASCSSSRRAPRRRPR